jgi:hypothetical protein
MRAVYLRFLCFLSMVSASCEKSNSPVDVALEKPLVG